MADKKMNKKERSKRMMALIIAGVMVFSVVAAAILSQVW